MKKITQVLLGQRTYMLLLIFIFLLTYNASSQEGKDGDLLVTAANTVLNTYSPITSDVTAGDTSIDVNSVAADLGGLSSGDLILIYQAQGATINITNTVNYGDISDYGSSGLYEFGYISSVSSNTITMTCEVANSYFVAGKTQVIKVPQYDTLTIQAGASVTSLAWEDFAGSRRGGVVAITANTIDIEGDIDTSGLGFRGGVGDNTTTTNGATVVNDFVTSISGRSAEKGEGIAGNQMDYDALGGRYGRGAAANAGGGGNSHNAGGGGGSNGNNGNTWFNGAGVMCSGCTGATAWTLDSDYIANGNALTNSSGGGRGGYSFGSSNQNALTLAPGSNAWGGDFRDEVGGLGGRPLIANEQNRIFLGGGGGSGDGNNSASQDAANGGGIILLGANSITGSGNIIANGANALPTVPNHNDAPGGGGGGGSIVLRAASIDNTLTLSANGGDGGDQLITNNESEGPGGGGGAGFVAISAGSPTVNINGGSNGITNSGAVTEFPTNGATSGASGQSVSGISNGAVTCSNPGTISGIVYNDANGDGVQGGESGIGSITITITDVNGNTQVITTNPDGSYTATLPPGNATIDILDSDPGLPVNAIQTQGDDPTSITVVAGINTASISDGFVIDTDGDGIGDPLDNCPLIANAGQEDSDMDGIGDVCDGDNDNDGVPNGTDVCPGFDDSVDNDGDLVPDRCDQDDDNDGILDIDELNCATTARTLNQTFSSTANPFSQAAVYPFDVSGTTSTVDASFTASLQGFATWSSGVSNTNGSVGVTDFVNLQANNTDFNSGDTYTYTLTFSETVYDVVFKWGGLDNNDRSDFFATSDGSQHTGVSITNDMGGGKTITANSVVSTAGGANAPSNSVEVSISGPVRTITVISAKQNGNAGNVTLQFYDLIYCVGVNSDGDGDPDHLDTDSDGDGCSDANEAYNDANADGGDGEQFGVGDPSTVDPSTGLVTETGVDYTLGSNPRVIASGATICTAPTPVLLHQNPACTSTVYNLLWDGFVPNGVDEFDWTPDGALTNTFSDVDGSGINITHTFSGETGTLSNWPVGFGGATPSVSSNATGIVGDDVLEYFTSGFGATGITQTITFSTDVYSVGFDLYHINSNGSGNGDLFTVTATDGAGNTIFPTFTDSGTPSYTSDGNTGEIDATGNSVANQDDQIGINFEDLDGITSITIVWQNCTTCSTGAVHGSAIGGFDFCTVIPSVSDLSLTKGFVLTTDADTSGGATPGDTVTFTVTVSNSGPNNATGVEVTDQVPNGYTIVGTPTVSQGTYTVGTGIWDVGTINNSGNATLTIIATINATGDYVNVAEVTASDNFDPDSTPDNDVLAEDDQDNADPGVSPASDLSLTKGFVLTTDADTSGGATPGDTVTFTVTVSNSGPNNATGVEVTDQVPNGYTIVGTPTVSQGAYTVGTGIWDVGTINNSGNATLTIIATINATGDYVNVAEVTASDNFDPDSTPDNDVLAEDDQDNADPGVSPASDLSLTKGFVLTTDADTSGGATPGDTVTFTVTVSNSGPNNATGVEVTDQVPNGYTIVGTPTVSQGTYTVGTGIWDVGTINNSGNATLTIIATINATGDYVNVAEVTASDNFDPDSTPDNDVLAEDDQDNADPGVSPASDLSLTKGFVLTTDADTSGGATPGDTVTFTVTVSNSGPNNATGVEVTDQVPNGYTIVGTPTVSQGTYTVGTGIWDVGTINNSGNATLTIIATINATGDYVNVAEVTASDNFDPDSTPDNDVLAEDDQDNADPGVSPASDLSLTKGFVLTTDADTSGGATPGDTVTFTVTVSNSGPNNATGVEVTDQVPNGYTIVGTPTVSQGTYTVGTGIWDVGTINNSGNATLTIIATINATGDYVNVAEVTASDNFDPDSTPDNDVLAEDDQDNADPGVSPASDLSLTKGFVLTTDADTSGGATPGDTVTFTVTVSNSGPNNATGVEVTDQVPNGYTIVGTPTVSQGTYTVGTGIWDVGTINNSGNATLTIIATINATGDYVNVAEVTASDNFDPDSTPDNDVLAEDDQDNADPGVSPASDLSLTKGFVLTTDADTSGGATPGDTVTFTVTVSNSGPNNATGVEVTDQVPNGYTIVGTPTVSQGTYTVGTGIWDVGTINNSGNATLTIIATINATGDYVNVAEVTASDNFDPDSTPDNDVLAEDDQDNADPGVSPASDLSLTKGFVLTTDADTSGGATPGDTVTFTVTVSNSGPNNATGVEVTDQIPNGYTIVGTPTVSQGTYTLGTGIWDVGTINNSGNATLTIIATINATGDYVNVAEVTASDNFDPDSTPDNDVLAEDDQDDADPGVSSVSDLSLTKGFVLTTDADTSGGATPGDTVTFTVTVSNSGPNNATGVEVTDQVPNGYTIVGTPTVSQGTYTVGTGIWDVGTINNSGNATLTIIATINATGDYVNVAEVTASDNFDPDSTPDNDVLAEDDQDNADPGVSPASDLSLTKGFVLTTDADTSGGATPGDTVTFTVTVSNSGPNNATGVEVTDQIPNGYTIVGTPTVSQGTYTVGTGIWDVGTINNSGNATLTVVVTVNATGDYVNVAEVTASDNFDPDSTPDNDVLAEDDQDNADPGVSPASDLSLTKGFVLTTDADTSGGATPGDTVTFTVTVSNSGPNNATGVEVTDQVPNGYTIVGTPTVSQGTYTVGTGIWDVGTINNSGNATLTIIATINATGDYVNVAEVTASDNFDPDSTPDNDVLAEDDQDNADPGVSPASDLSLTKGFVLTTDADTSGGATPGDTVTFTVTVSNSGPNDATGVEVTDQIPNGYTIVGTPTASQGTYTVGTGIWDVGTINNSGNATLTVVVTVNATGDYVNVAEVTASDNFDPDSTPDNDVLAEDDQDDSDPGVSPVSDLDVVKGFVLTTDADGSTNVTPGDTVTFTVTVSNSGPNDATGVEVTDQIPNGYTIVGTPTVSQGTYTVGTGIWDVGTITNSGNATLTVVVTVNATGDYVNVAEVTASDNFDPDSTPDNDVLAEDDQDDSDPGVSPVSDLDVVKGFVLTTDADSSTNVTPGDTVTFTVTVSNSGPNDATGVEVTDQIPNGYTIVGTPTASQGTYTVGTGIWDVGTITNSGNATLTVVVTVNATGDYVNVAEVTASDNFDPDSTPDNDVLAEDDQDDADPGVSPASDLSLTKGFVLTTDADTSGGATPGDTVTFTVTVSNSGPNDTTGVEVTDQVPNGYTIVGTPTVSQGTYTVGTGIWDVGTITNSGNATLTIIATINATGDYVNVAEVTASDNFDPDSTPDNDVLAEDDQDNADPGVSPASDLSLTKGFVLTTDADTSGGATPGDTVTFTVTVSNSGPNDATGVEVTDQIPNGYTIVGTPTVSQGTYTVGTGIWDVGTINNSGNATLTVVVTVNATGDYVNVAEVTASDNFDPDSTPDNDVLAEDDQDDSDPGVSSVSDLDVVKGFVLTTDADTSGGTTPGDTVTFTVTVSNSGPNDATGVEVTDQIPNGYTIVGTPTASQGTYTVGTGIWDVGTINNSGNATLTIIATINATGDYVNVAEVTASDNFDPDSTPDNDVLAEDDQDDSDPGVNAVSDLDVVKGFVLTTDADGSTNVTPGDTVTFTVTVSNSGPNDATGVEVTDQIPNGYTIVGTPTASQGTYTVGTGIWDVGTINNSGNATLTVVVTVNATGDYVNVAEVTASDNFDPDSTPDNDVLAEDDQDDSDPGVSPVSDLDVVKGFVLTTDADGSTNVTPGDTVTFTVTVSNSGPNDATGVEVTDQIPNGYTIVGTPTVSQGTYTVGTGIWDVGTITNSGNATLTVVVTVNATGDYVNVAEVTASDNFDPDSTPDNDVLAEDDQDDSDPGVSPVSDLDVVKGFVLTTDADSSTNVTPGDTVTFTVTVSNSGPNNATGVEVTDQIPNGYTIVGTPTVSQGTYTLGTGIWDVGTINNSGNATLTIIATINATGDYVNVAEVTASDNFDPDSTPDNDVLAEDDQDDADPGVSSVSDLSLTKGFVLTTDADTSGGATPGDTVTFTVTVSNSGPNDATGVEVTDQVPNGYTIVGTPTVSQGTYTVGTGIWDVGTITNSGNATLTIIATINATGDYVNVAEVTASDNFDPDSTPDNDVLAEDDQDNADPGVSPASDLSLTKGFVLTTDADTSGGATPGDTVTFTVTVSNSGPNNATGVEVTDQIPNGYTIVGTPTVSQGTYTLGTGIWDVGTINNSGNATLTIIATINATGDYVNVAEVTASDNFDPDSTPDNDVLAEDDQDNADPGVSPASDLSLTKGFVLTTDADTSGGATPGDTVTFTVTVSNSGPNDATGVEVTDQIPNGYTIVGTPTVSQGTYTVGTGIWDVGTITNSGNATLTVVVTVNATGDYVNVAEVTASDNFDPDSTPDNDVLAEDDQDDSDPGVNAVSDLDVVKGFVLTTDADGSTNVTPGDTVTFTVTVSNSGPNDATGVEVTDQIPNGYTIVGTPTASQGTYTVGTGIWDVGTITNSGNATLTVVVTVNATGDYVNVAEVTASDNFDPDSTPDNDVLAEDDQDDSDPGVSPVSDLDVVKGFVLTTDADSSTNVTPGDTVTFTVTVSNSGPNDATGVEVTDQIPNGYTIVGTPTVSQGTYTVGTGIWDVGTITNSGNATLTVVVTVNATGDYVNVAEVTASDNFDPDSTPDNDVLAEDDQDDSDPGVSPVSDLDVVKGFVLTTDADSSTNVTPGDTVTFTVTVSNSGPNDATGVEVTDQIPNGYTIVGTPTASQGTYTVGTGIWDVGTITNSGNATLTVVVTVNATGDYVNVAEVTASDNFDPDSTPDNDVLAEDDQDDSDPGVSPVSDLDVVKGFVLTTDADSSTNVTPGDTVTFTVTVSNSGPNDATGVEVTDQIPNGYTIVGTPTVSQGTYTVGTGIWDVGTINNSGNATLTVVVTVNATGDYVNVAEVTASDNFDPDSTPDNDVLAEDDQDDSDPGVSPVSDLDVVKGFVLTTDADTSGGATPGDTVTFTVTVSNSGPNDATGVEVTDQVPNGYTIVGTPTVSQGTYTVGTGIWDVGTITNSGNATLTIIATINATGDYVNVAEVTASDNFDPDSTPDNDVLAEDDQDNADPGVSPASDLSLTKGFVLTTDADTSGGATPGDTVTFTVTVSNSGPNDATGVEVTDQIPNGYTIVGTPTVSQGTYTVGTGIWDVGTINNSGNATLTVVVTVNATGDYVNVAEVTASDNFDPDSTPDNDVLAEDDQDDSDPGVSPVSDLDVVKGFVLTTDADSSTNVTPGDTVTFTVTVSNSGPNDATGVEVTDQIPNGYTIVGTPTASQGTYTVGTGIWDVGTITNSGNATLTVVVTVNATGDYVNVAEVTASDNFDPDSTPDNDVLAEDDQDDSDPGVSPVSDLDVVKGFVLTTDADSSTNVTPGDTVTFTVTVSNSGPNDATGVEVTDQIPNGYTIVGTPTVSQGTYTVGTGIWDVGTINNSGNATLTVVVTVNATGDYVNVAEVTASDNFDPDSTPDNDVLAEDDQDDSDPGVSPVSDLDVVKGFVLTTDADSSTNVTPGDTVTFTVTVSNSGPNDATGVEVTDQIPNGYTIVGTPTASQGTYTVGTGIWDVGTITNSGNATLTVVVTVNATGDYVNVAEVTASDNFDPDSTPDNDVLAEDDQDDSDPGVSPVSDLDVVKGFVLTTDADGSTNVTPGDTVTFTVTVSNSGPNDATGVEVTDQIPNGYTIVGTPTVSQGTYTVGTGIWDVGTINNSGNATLTVVVTVNATGDYVNVAEVTASDNFDPDSTPDNDVLAEDDQDDSDPGVSPVSDLDVVKGFVLTTDADSSTNVTPGDTVTFTVTVSNSGPNDATGVEVTDQIPNGYTIVGTPTASQGTYTVGTGIWDVGTITNSGNATLTVVVTVNATGDYVNVAEVTASDNFDPDSTPDNDVLAEDDQDDSDPGVNAANDLSIVKSALLTTDADTNTVISVGDTVTFSITISNDGPSDATGVGVGDTVPDGYTAIGSISNGGTFSGGVISWSGLDITTTTPLVLTYTAVITDTGNYTNFAEITASDNFDPDSTPDSTPDADTPVEDDETSYTVPVPELTLVKTGVANGSSVGDTITYTFTVTNTGNVTLDNVFIDDMLTGSNNLAVSPSTLAPGEQGTATAEYVITQADINNGEVINSATVIGEDPNGDDVIDVSDNGDETVDDNGDSDPTNDETITDIVQLPNLALTKTGVYVDVNGDDLPNVGDEIRYTFTVENTGNVDITNIVLTDPLIGIVVAGGPIDLLVGEIDTTTFTATYVLTADDVLLGEVVNQAIVTGQDPNGDDVVDISDDLIDTEDVDLDNDGDGEDETVTVIEGVFTDEDDPIIIYTGISPNGDDINDEFRIVGLRNFPDNTLRIYNRWGVQVFEEDGYEQPGVELFKGISNGRVTISEKNKLPVGTYYYVLEYINARGVNTYKAGYLYINR